MEVNVRPFPVLAVMVRLILAKGSNVTIITTLPKHVLQGNLLALFATVLAN
jgi:hypothetical protein